MLTNVHFSWIRFCYNCTLPDNFPLWIRPQPFSSSIPTLTRNNPLVDIRTFQSLFFSFERVAWCTSYWNVCSSEVSTVSELFSSIWRDFSAVILTSIRWTDTTSVHYKCAHMWQCLLHSSFYAVFIKRIIMNDSWTSTAVSYFNERFCLN